MGHELSSLVQQAGLEGRKGELAGRVMEGRRERRKEGEKEGDRRKERRYRESKEMREEGRGRGGSIREGGSKKEK